MKPWRERFSLIDHKLRPTNGTAATPPMAQLALTQATNYPLTQPSAGRQSGDRGGGRSAPRLSVNWSICSMPCSSAFFRLCSAKSAALEVLRNELGSRINRDSSTLHRIGPAERRTEELSYLPQRAHFENGGARIPARPDDTAFLR